MRSFILSQTAPVSPNMWVIYALGAVTVVYAVFLRPMMRQKKDPLFRPPSAGTSLAQQRAVERQMETLLVELADMARQITAQLDTRATKLEVLLKEADERIAALKEAMRNASAAPGPRPAAAGLPVPVAPPPPTEDPRHLAVYELADAGFTSHDIAQELQRPRGEIDLILALRAR